MTDSERTPRTAAGRSLLASAERYAGHSWFPIAVREWVPKIEAEAAALPERAGLDVQTLAKAMHPTWFEELDNLTRPATLTPREWNQMILNVNLRRADAIREATEVLARLPAALAASPATESPACAVCGSTTNDHDAFAHDSARYDKSGLLDPLGRPASPATEGES